jgi:AcrR family transcriptional regulator
MSIESIVLHKPRNREDQKRATRLRLIEAAIRVFARRGILASSTAEVAREASLSHGSVFAHFGTQEALISAVIEAFGEALARRLHELAASGAGTREVLEAHLRGLAEREDFYARLVVEAPLLPRRARDSLVAIQSSVCHHLSPAVEADLRRGRIRPMPLHLLFNTWIGLVHHYLANRDLFAPGASVIERRGGEILGHFMSLLAKGGYAE